MAAAAPTPAQLQALLAAMIARLMRLFVRRGAVVAEPDRAWLADAQDREDDGDMAAADGPSALPILHLASTTYRIATGPHAGRRIATIGGGHCAAGRGEGKPLCAEITGFSLHAATRCRADDRYRLARLCRYIARPAFADDQLSWDGAGAAWRSNSRPPWRDGTTHLDMTPIDFMERLAALVPRPDDHATGINPVQGEALRYLARANRFSRTPAALADYLGSTRGTVSQTLLALEAKGLIEKEANARDGRSVTLTLTRAGAAFLEADSVRALARAIDRTGAAKRLADDLEDGLRAAIAERGGRAFGACHTCRHFRRDQRTGSSPHHCALLDEPLRNADSRSICFEQTT